MKIDCISDTHLEMADLELPGGDILIMAGDILEAVKVTPKTYDPLNIMDGAGNPKRMDRYYRFLVEECAKYNHVIYVMGNHESYNFMYNKTYDHLKQYLPNNVALLENQSIELDGVVFVGGTMWTDLNGDNPLTEFTVRGGMNDYRAITNHYKDRDIYYRLTPAVTRAAHTVTKQYISDTVLAAGSKPCVVVTHHAPSLQSISPRFKNEFHMNGGYCSDMDDFILAHPQIVAWHHGHVHSRFKYQIGPTWVLCNPRGYVGYESMTETFKPQGYTLGSSGQIAFDSDEWL